MPATLFRPDFVSSDGAWQAGPGAKASKNPKVTNSTVTALLKSVLPETRNPVIVVGRAALALQTVRRGNGCQLTTPSELRQQTGLSLGSVFVISGLPLRDFYGETTVNQNKRAISKHGSAESRMKLSIKVVGSGLNDPLVFNYIGSSSS